MTKEEFKTYIFNKINVSYVIRPPLHKGTKCDIRFKSSLNWVQTYKWVFFPMRFKNSLN